MRDVVTDIIANHVELIRKAEIQALMTEFSGLSLEVLLQKVNEHGWALGEK